MLVNVTHAPKGEAVETDIWIGEVTVKGPVSTPLEKVVVQLLLQLIEFVLVPQKVTTSVMGAHSILHVPRSPAAGFVSGVTATSVTSDF
jgi:hypothetical protein